MLHSVNRNVAIMWSGTRSSLHCADKRVSGWVSMSRYTVKTYYAGVQYTTISFYYHSRKKCNLCEV